MNAKFAALAFLALLVSLSAAGRPPFDKSAHKKTVWIHANSWFAPNKDRLNSPLGGPDVAFRLYPQGRVWAETAKQLARYGINGIQYEIGIWKPKRVPSFSEVLDEFVASGTEMQGCFFIPIHMPKFHENMVKFLELSRPEWEHPRYHRIDGNPVIVLYRYWAQKPDAIAAMIEEAERKCGQRFIWLAEMMYAKDETLRKYLPVLDGISMYGNWTIDNQQEYFRRLAPIMHNEFPEKLFEAGVQSQYCDHFHMGGIAPRNLDKYLASWQTSLEAEPDSLCLTNLFDHSENSHLLPSWAWEDVMMRIAQYHINQWRGLPMAKTPANIRPEIYVVHSANTILGWDAHFDLISFPHASQKAETVEFSLVNAAGKVLKDFGKVTLATDRMDIRRFEVNTAEFADEPALYPKIRWQVMPKGTNLTPGWLPWKLYFASGTENALKTQLSKHEEVPSGSWTMDGAKPGETIPYPADGKVCVTANVTPMFQGAYNHAKNNRCRILRNGREFLSFPCQMLNFTQLYAIPDPSGAVDAYQLELENEGGYRHITLPIYVAGGKRTGKVTVPIPEPDMRPRSYTLDANRIPYFHYPCDTDDGRLLRDVSGYGHDGFIAGVSFQGGHLPMVGYRHEHHGYVSNQRAADPQFLRDADGRGFYRFCGKGYIMVMGQGMPPYASTVELSVRLSKHAPGGLFGTGNSQLTIEVLPDGRIQASRAAAREGMAGAKAAEDREAIVVSRSPIPLDEWVRVAVVYDCQNLSLYLNGELQGQAPFSPRADHEWFNAVVLGAKGTFPFAGAKEHFTGDLTRIRIYARNLSPEEFLK